MNPQRELWQVADLQIDLGRQRVLREKFEIPLPKLSFDMRVALPRGAPNFVSNEGLMARVWPAASWAPAVPRQ